MGGVTPNGNTSTEASSEHGLAFTGNPTMIELELALALLLAGLLVTVAGRRRSGEN